MSSAKRFERAKMNLDTGSCSEHMEQETEDSIEQPVVSVSLMVELGSFKVTMKTVWVDL